MLNPNGLSDILLFCTAKISVVKENNQTSFGTGFFFEIFTSPNRHLFVLITNKHVIRGSTEGEFYIYRANSDGTPNGEFETFLIRNSQTAWINHPNENIDLCAYIINPNDIFDRSPNGTVWRVSALKETLILNMDELKTLRTIEDVIMVGYPDGLYDLDSKYPLIRKGITSLHPAITYNRTSGRSLGVLDISAFPGSSGSPIFIYNDGIPQTKGETIELDKRLILLGVLSDWYVSRPESSSIFDKGYHLNLGFYIKAQELFDLGKEVIKFHLMNFNPEITKLVETELEQVTVLANESIKIAIVQLYMDVTIEIANYILSKVEASQMNSVPPLQTIIKEINYLIEEDAIDNIIAEDFDLVLNIRNLAIKSPEKLIDEKTWLSALEATKRIIISFRKLQQP